jgi:pyrroline-5-carboxylate reductase
MTCGIIGVGAIAAAIVRGLSDGCPDAPAILLSPRNPVIAANLAGRYANVSIAADNQGVIDGASLVILAVRPQDAETALGGLVFSHDQTVISLVAGLQTPRVRDLVKPATKVARAIPLPAVAVREGVTPIYPRNGVAGALFDRMGSAVFIENENAFDAFSAASSTVAAHFAYLDAVSAWLAAQDVPAEDARHYVASVFSTLADTLRADTADFAERARDHATPGGFNEYFMALLHEAGVFGAVTSGLDRVLARLRGR